MTRSNLVLVSRFSVQASDIGEGGGGGGGGGSDPPMEARIAALEQALPKLLDGVKVLTESVNSMRIDVAVAKSEVSAARADLAPLKADVNVLRPQLSDLRGSVDTRLATVDGSLRTLQESVGKEIAKAGQAQTKWLLGSLLVIFGGMYTMLNYFKPVSQAASLTHASPAQVGVPASPTRAASGP